MVATEWKGTTDIAAGARTGQALTLEAPQRASAGRRSVPDLRQFHPSQGGLANSASLSALVWRSSSGAMVTTHSHRERELGCGVVVLEVAQ